MWRPWWVQVTSGFLCMCAVWSPQAVTCGFNPPAPSLNLRSFSPQTLHGVSVPVTPALPWLPFFHFWHQNSFLLPWQELLYTVSPFFPDKVIPCFVLAERVSSSSETLSHVVTTLSPLHLFLASHCLERITPTSFFYFFGGGCL